MVTTPLPGAPEGTRRWVSMACKAAAGGAGSWFISATWSGGGT